MSKKNIFRIILFAGTAISLFYVPWPIVKAWIMPLPDTVEEQMEDALEYGFEGMIVYVDQGGKASEFYAKGWHDREKKIPAKADAYFKIASISKLYAAVAATKLVKDGRISLDATLAEMFPELVGRIEFAEKITLRMMIQHRSGIPNFTDNPSFWTDAEGERKEALDYALDLPAHFEPDQDYAYSNTNYLLLRWHIDRVIGYDHNQFIKEEILIPLGLEHTFASVNDVDPEEMMSGYYVGLDEDFKSEDAGMVATAEDVGVFLRALNDGSVFEEGEKAIYDSIYVYDHGGLVPGYQSLAEYHEDMDAVIVQFMNTTDFEGYEWNLSEIFMNRIAKIVSERQ